MEKVADSYTQDRATGTPLAGGGGVFTFRFKALRAGQTTIKLIYHRPWEKDAAPLSTHSIELTIR